ncbi:MAG: biotin/lipoyl-binding protein, partial [Candidatus Latescibacteria bacterium]|nr:biotin/lipoyl-binding protein [Candidatus Latescibacterota bacterium]
QTIKATMPGRVMAVEVAVGEEVSAGQGVVIIEAMKMENELKTHVAGRVKEIRAAAGDAVNKGDVLVVLEEAAVG